MHNPIINVTVSITPANERSYSPDEQEFMNAVDAWKTRNHRRFPSHSEYLSILLSLGYKKG